MNIDAGNTRHEMKGEQKRGWSPQFLHTVALIAVQVTLKGACLIVPPCEDERTGKKKKAKGKRERRQSITRAWGSRQVRGIQS